VATHVKVIAGGFAAAGAMLLIGAFFAQFALQLMAGIVATSGDDNAQAGAAVLGFAGVALTAMLVVFAVPFFVTAWGLFNFKPWARIAGIVLGALSLMSVPLGTLLGVYALVVLFQKDTEKLFNASSGV
jgi:hypothetical protein